MKRGEQFISVLFLNLIIIFIAIERGATQNCNTDVDMEIWYSGELNSTYSTDCYTVFANKTNVDNYFLRILTIPVDPDSPYIESICTEIPSISYQECVSSDNIDGSDLICVNATDGFTNSNVIYINVQCVGSNCPYNTTIGYQIYFGWVYGEYDDYTQSQCNTDGIPLPIDDTAVIYWGAVFAIIIVLLLIGAVISGGIIYKIKKDSEQPVAYIDINDSDS